MFSETQIHIHKTHTINTENNCIVNTPPNNNEESKIGFENQTVVTTEDSTSTLNENMNEIDILDDEYKQTIKNNKPMKCNIFVQKQPIANVVEYSITLVDDIVNTALMIFDNFSETDNTEVSDIEADINEFSETIDNCTAEKLTIAQNTYDAYDCEIFSPQLIEPVLKIQDDESLSIASHRQAYNILPDEKQAVVESQCMLLEQPANRPEVVTYEQIGENSSKILNESLALMISDNITSENVAQLNEPVKKIANRATYDYLKHSAITKNMQLILEPEIILENPCQTELLYSANKVHESNENTMSVEANRINVELKVNLDNSETDRDVDDTTTHKLTTPLGIQQIGN